MKKTIRLFLSVCIMISVFLGVFIGNPEQADARDGIGGFDGTGISQGEINGKTTLSYQEYIFVTGEPILVKGTLVIGKTVKDNVTALTYSYKLNNRLPMVQLTRDFTFETVSTVKENGQTVTETSYTKEPSEKIVTAGKTYTLRTYDFTRTSLIDEKPAVSYYSGNSWYRKQYEISGGTGTSASGNFVTVEGTGEFYGFDQYWGNADVEITDLVIDYQEGVGADAESWSGTANVRRSQSNVTGLRYVENEPNAISFRGGFLETRKNDNVLEYQARLPEFTENGISTDKIKRYSDSVQIETFPSTRRLISPDLRQIRGHWAEEALSKLFGLEILRSGASQYNPEQYITRAEFADAIISAAKSIPADPFIKLSNNRKKASPKKAVEPEPIFTDVPSTHVSFAQIEEAYTRGLFLPMSKNEFSPNGHITVADASVVFIRAMGLESLASYHGAITNFTDDDNIPDYARNALYVSSDIGLLRGDQDGNIHPNNVLTKGEAAVMIDRFVEYMREDLKDDYRDRMLDF